MRKFNYFARRYDYAVSNERSKAIPVAKASISIGSFRAAKPVLPKADAASADYATNARGEATAVKFIAALKAGKTRLAARFADKAGQHLTTAYYVQVTRR